MNELRTKLIELYQKMAEMTLPCCKACRVPLSCCSPEYCAMTIQHAKEHWGVDLKLTDHPKLPLMGPNGCTAAPHLRPVCSVHTCQINAIGLEPKLGTDWNERYFKLREEILQVEELVFKLEMDAETPRL